MKIKDIIWESDNFLVVTIQCPHIDRNDGGHIVIVCKVDHYHELEELPLQIAYEMIGLAQNVGMAMKKVLKDNGIDIKIINYQLNGNWSAKELEKNPLHLHLYGRSISSENQKFGEALYLPSKETGFYNNFNGLTKYDINGIRKVLENIKQTQEFPNEF